MVGMYQRVLKDHKVDMVHSQSSHFFLIQEGSGSEGSAHGIIAGISRGCSNLLAKERVLLSAPPTFPLSSWI